MLNKRSTICMVTNVLIKAVCDRRASFSSPSAMYLPGPCHVLVSRLSPPIILVRHLSHDPRILTH